jgi:hypothetical protein
MRENRVAWTLSLSFFSLVGAACSDTTPRIETGAAGQGAVTGAAGTSAPAPGPGPAAAGTNAAAPCVTGAPSPSPLRRLTHVEYANTVRDLLGVTLSPADTFPADPITGGFANNASVLTVTALQAEKYLEAAEALAAEAVKKLSTLVPCQAASATDEACARQFIARFGRRAYRRPLAPEDTDRLLRAFRAGAAEGTFAAGIELVIQTALQSPSFLHRLELGAPAPAGAKVQPLTQHELAARLSYFLWSSMPDPTLDAAADAGQLGTLEQVAAKARAMLADPRARPAVGEFYRQWLGLGALPGLVKDAAVHPEFNDQLRAAMRAETQAFVEHVVWTGDHKLQTLLTSNLGFPDAALAKVYGVTGPTGAAPQMVTLPAAQRAGVLTHAGVLAVHALPDQSSPVSRGKFVREQLLCTVPPPPPPNLNVTPPDVDPTKPTRERFAAHTADASCAACHTLMDPIGFGFEAFDAVGRFRATDGGRAVDDSGEIFSSKDANGPFKGARQLAERLAGSEQVRDCVATQWFRYAMGRFDGAGDLCSLAPMRAGFAASGGDLQELLVALTQTEAFLTRRALAPGEAMP